MQKNFSCENSKKLTTFSIYVLTYTKYQPNPSFYADALTLSAYIRQRLRLASVGSQLLMASRSFSGKNSSAILIDVATVFLNHRIVFSGVEAWSSPGFKATAPPMILSHHKARRLMVFRVLSPQRKSSQPTNIPLMAS
jgi:hypothetical protein